MDYPALDELVRGKDVWLLAPGSEPPAPKTEDMLTVRFNSDRLPSDIFGSSFIAPGDPPVPPGAVFVIGTSPDAVVDVYAPKRGRIRRDFKRQFTCLDRSIPHEFVSETHWRELANAMPLLPLAGLVGLAMLQRTAMRSCTIHNFDFYASKSMLRFLAGSPTAIYPELPFFAMHDYLKAISHLRQMIAGDARTRWSGPRSLDELEAIWRRRLALLWAPYQAVRVAKSLMRRPARPGPGS